MIINSLYIRINNNDASGLFCRNIILTFVVLIYKDMDRKDIIDVLDPACPIRNIISRLSDKWTLLVLYNLETSGEPMRFSWLLCSIAGISQRMLTVTLKSLENDGIIRRKVYAEVPPHVEYALTARGKSLLPHIDSLIGWAKDNFDDIIADRTRNAGK